MVYRYKNQDTAEVIEIEQSIHAPAQSHVVRNGAVFSRLFEIVGVVYKTGGFYCTDNADSITKWQREHLARD